MFESRTNQTKRVGGAGAVPLFRLRHKTGGIRGRADADSVPASGRWWAHGLAVGGVAVPHGQPVGRGGAQRRNDRAADGGKDQVKSGVAVQRVNSVKFRGLAGVRAYL